MVMVLNRDVLLEWAFGMAESDVDRASILAIIDGTDSTQVPCELMDDTEKEVEERSLFESIREMSIPQKIKLALFGNQTARTILIRDVSNKQIPMMVLSNPRITDNEIFEISKNSNMDERVLREIGSNLTWMKPYAVKLAIVSNPKVPIDVSLKWIKHIRDKDLRILGRSKGIPQTVSTQCKKILETRDKK